jgi:hypothetical protein
MCALRLCLLQQYLLHRIGSKPGCCVCDIVFVRWLVKKRIFAECASASVFAEAYLLQSVTLAAAVLWCAAAYLCVLTVAACDAGPLGCC